MSIGTPFSHDAFRLVKKEQHNNNNTECFITAVTHTHSVLFPEII